MQRDAAHELRHIYPATVPPDGERLTREALVYLEISRISDAVLLAEIEQSLAGVIAEVTVVVEDFEPMCARVRELLAALPGCSQGVAEPEWRENRALLEWLLDGNFTFLGYEVLEVERGDGDDARRQPQRGEARAAARARHAGGGLPRAGARGAGAQPRGSSARNWCSSSPRAARACTALPIPTTSR